jgi:hypothetical protein
MVSLAWILCILGLVMPKDGAPLIVRASSSNPLETGTYTLSATPGPQHSFGTTTSNKLSITDPVNFDGSHRNIFSPGTRFVDLREQFFDHLCTLIVGKAERLAVALVDEFLVVES